jgi:uncharacterized membrane protein
MNRSLHFVGKALLTGFLAVLPVYLAVLLLLKAMDSVAKAVHPLTVLLPDWLPRERILSLLLVLAICFLIGALTLTRTGGAIRRRIETSFLQRIPGYDVIRGLTQQLSGENRQDNWKPALVELEEALVPAFIIEHFADGRYTVFVPSVPTPLSGALFILEPNRVHPVDVPFTQALRVVTKWGSGAQALEKAMQKAAGTSVPYGGVVAIEPLTSPPL